MKSLKHFIAESVRTYAYTIKIAGNVDKNFLDMFRFNLKKFDPVEISEPKSTPIQKDPYGFPNLENESVTIIKCVFRYPANEPMIQQVAQLLGYNVNLVRVVKTSYDDSINDEMDGYSNQMRHSPVLTHEEMEEEKNAKAASKAYGDSYLQSIKDQSKDDKIQYVYDAKKTPDAFDPFKPFLDNDPKGTDSPMSKITRPAKPQTGAHRG